MQAQVANPKPAPLTAEEAVAQAAAEGLTLEKSRFASGYKGVSIQGRRYQAYVMRAGKFVSLGYFATAEEAALAVARDARSTPPAVQLSLLGDDHAGESETSLDEDLLLGGESGLWSEVPPPTHPLPSRLCPL